MREKKEKCPVEAINFNKQVLVPIRDMEDMSVVFVLHFYGLDAQQLALIPFGQEGKEDVIDRSIGSLPIIDALKKRGFDTDRYRAIIWDLVS